MNKTVFALILALALPAFICASNDKGSQLASQVLKGCCKESCGNCGKCCKEEDNTILRCDVCGGKDKDKAETKCACGNKPKPKAEQE